MERVANPPLSRDTPDDIRCVTALPDAVHNLIEYETACAYADGWRAALEAVATGQVELDETWHEIGRRRHEEFIAERLAQSKKNARDLAERMKRPRGYWYPGQRRPVDWDTGRILRPREGQPVA